MARGSFLTVSLITFFYALSCFDTRCCVASFSISSSRMKTPRPFIADSKCFRHILAIVYENFSLEVFSSSSAPLAAFDCFPLTSPLIMSFSIRWTKGWLKRSCLMPVCFDSSYGFCTYLNISSTKSDEPASPCSASATKRFFMTLLGLVSKS